MQQQNEENVHYSHNNREELPATFCDVEDEILRNFNRGAVLANIFERYVDKRTKRLMGHDFVRCIREIEQYLGLIPENEQADAKASMRIHLEERGYVNVS